MTASIKFADCPLEAPELLKVGDLVIDDVFNELHIVTRLDDPSRGFGFTSLHDGILIDCVSDLFELRKIPGYTKIISAEINVLR